MAVPTKVALSLERLQHKLLHNSPVGTELEKINAENLQGSVIILERPRPEKTVIKGHDQRPEPEIADQVVERIGTILAPAERYDAIIGIFPAMEIEQVVEFFSLRRPINLCLFVFDLSADIAHALVVEDDGLLRFGQQASSTQPQIVQNP